MSLSTVAALVLVFTAPAAAFWLLSRGFDWLVAYERRPRPAAADPGDPAGDDDSAARGDRSDLAALGSDLRRLTGEHAWLLKADVPGKATRLRAVQLAYDDTLLRAARLLEVDMPEPPLQAVARLQAEAELATHGFTW